MRRRYLIASGMLLLSSYLLVVTNKDLALQLDNLQSQYSDLEKDLDSLKAASKPGKDELDRLEELKKIMRDEEKEIARVMSGSKKLKEMVSL